MSYNSPPMILFFGLTLYVIVKQAVIFFKKPVAAAEGSEQLDEGLAPYYVALDQNDYECFVGQEQHFSEKHYIKTLTQTQFNMMIQAAPKEEEQKLDS